MRAKLTIEHGAGSQHRTMPSVETAWFYALGWAEDHGLDTHRLTNAAYDRAPVPGVVAVGDTTFHVEVVRH